MYSETVFNDLGKKMWGAVVFVRYSGLVVIVLATRSAHPGFESRPGDLTTGWSEGRQIAL